MTDLNLIQFNSIIHVYYLNRYICRLPFITHTHTYTHTNSTLLKHNPSTNYLSLWNKLPKTITNEKLSTTFKTKLHRHVLELN